MLFFVFLKKLIDQQLFEKIQLVLRILLLLALSTHTPTSAQNIPPLTYYAPSDYMADNQNWQTSQSSNGTVYIANNRGLLQFNGDQWQLYTSPNKTIIRSVKVIHERIFTGAHMDFGYWDKQSTGLLEYTSLTERFDIRMIEGEQIWKILPFNNKIIFQSLNGLYVYYPQTNKIDYIAVDVKNTMYRVFEIDNALFVQVHAKGLYTIDKGKTRLINDHSIFKTAKFIAIFKWKSQWLGVTQDNGFYRIDGTTVQAWEHTAAARLTDVTIYSAVLLSDGSIGLGTIANGFIKLTDQGDWEYQVTQESGLGNNTVLSLYEDSSHNIWIGLDNGITCINTKMPITSYVDQVGRLGTIYAAAEHNDILYLGTNQGLFYKKALAADFCLVSGTEGQVWALKVIDGNLFCGHDRGTFIITDGKQQQIGFVNGTWDFERIAQRSDIILQGNYDGLYLLQSVGDTWKLKNKIERFDVSSKHFELVDVDKILVSNEYKGVYEIAVDSAFAKAKNVTLITPLQVDEHSSIEKFENTIYYSNRKGIYNYNEEASLFEIDSVLTKSYKDTYVSGKLLNDEHGRLWAFTENNLLFFEKDPIEPTLSSGSIELPQRLRNSVMGYENIIKLEGTSSSYLLGTTNGYLTLQGEIPEAYYEIQINTIKSNERNQTPRYVPLDRSGTFDSHENTLVVTYNIPEFQKYQQAQYQYRVAGFYDQWSAWQSDATHTLANIPAGEYTFEVRGKVGRSMTSNTASYSFIIEKAWYFTYLAIFIYMCIGLLVLVLYNKRTKKRYKMYQKDLLDKTKRDLELKALAIEKENIELRNQNLRSDIDARSRELATSTMNMITKSKTLHTIKEKLIPLNTSRELDDIIKEIDKNISTKEDWNFFETAFNHADKDFFKKVKKLHPELTTNDLKLCVYLRLNMTSKEIAPLLNISHRSVEIKRYRLRKKISLEKSVNLNNYFMNL